MPLQAMNLRVPRSPVLRRNSISVTMRSGTLIHEIIQGIDNKKNLLTWSGDFSYYRLMIFLGCLVIRSLMSLLIIIVAIFVDGPSITSTCYIDSFARAY